MADDAGTQGWSDYRWQGRDASPPPGTRGLSRGTWLTVLAGLILAFLTTLVVWLLFIKPPPPPPFYLSISIAEYNDRRYPTLGFTRQDATRILRHFPEKKQAETAAKDLLSQELKGLAAKCEPLIVHLTSLALARDGKVFLIPGDAKPDDESSWLEIQEVLEALAACPAKDKLLILDLAHPLADPQLGVLADRVAQTLEARLEQDKPPFLVLCPCAAGQMSLASEVLGGSVLAYYLDQGLFGHADANQDHRVTLRELAAFLEARVDRWADVNRGLRQKPRLFGDGDFVIVSVGKETPAELPAPELAAYPERLREDWLARDDWRNKGAFRRAPRTLAKLDANLLRQESQWAGGVFGPKALAAAGDESSILLTELAAAMLERHVPARSLPLALAQSGPTPDAELGDAVLNILANIKPAGGKKETNVKVEEDLLKRLKTQKNADFPRQARAVFEALQHVPQLLPDHFHVALSVLKDLQPRPPYLEFLYARRIVDFAARKDLDAWRAKYIQAILHTLRTRETAIAALDREPAALSWLADAIEAGDDHRRAAEKKLLWHGASTWEAAFEQLQAARGKYESALGDFQIIQGARRGVDQAMADLPAYLRLLCDGPDLDPPAVQAWLRAIDETERLQTFLAAPPKAGASEKHALQADTPARDLQRYLQILEKTLRRRIDLAQKEENSEASRQLLALLQSPLLTSVQRTNLLAKQRAVAVKLNEECAEQDQQDNRAKRIRSGGGAAPGNRAAAQGLARARMALALLRLTMGQIEIKNLTIPAGADEITPKQWANLEKKTQTLWTKTLVEQWSAANSPFRADALNRLVSPWQRDVLDIDPSVALHKNQRAAFRRWLEERCRAEARDLADNPQEEALRTFYLDAARDLTP